jgi:maltose O-acetyltransferase
MVAGELYWARDPELVAARERSARLLGAYNAAGEEAERRALLGELLGSLGDGGELRPPFWCDYGSNIHVGSQVFANFGFVVLDVTPVTIGDHVQMGPYVQLLAADHPRDPGLRRAGRENGAPITIGENAWLGGGVVVCPGVTIGADSIVGAGSIVTRDVPAGVVAAGNPCRVIRPL